MIKEIVNKILVSSRLAMLCFPFSGGADSEENPIHIRYAHELTKSVIPILEKEFDLHCYGDGGSMADNVAEISLHFQAQRRASVAEARELLIRCKRCVLDAINNNKLIRPYLAEYPFPAERADVLVSFGSFYGDYADNTIAFLFQTRDSIHYYKTDPITNRSQEIFSERYDEALKIVNGSSLPDSAFRKHAKKPYEDDLDRFFYSFVAEARKKWGVVGVLPGGDMSDGIKEFAFSFKLFKRTSIEEARKLLVNINELLLQKINHDERLRPYLKAYPFPLEKTRIVIQFQKSEKEGFRDGSLVSVLQDGGKLLYHVKDADKEDAPTLFYPILVREETYDEALQILYPHPK